MIKKELEHVTHGPLVAEVPSGSKLKGRVMPTPQGPTSLFASEFTGDGIAPGATISSGGPPTFRGMVGMVVVGDAYEAM